MLLVAGPTQQEPIVPFLILLAVILVIPLLFERMRLPGLVGLLAAGVVLGADGLQVLKQDSESMRLLSDIGLVYLMFVAGLEVDIEQFNRTRNRSIGFGIFTFLVPLLTGTFVGRLFGFDWNASVLIGSLFASHTLLAYPIVSRLGVVGNEAVTITIGATIFTDIGSLLVLAVCVGIHAGDFSPLKLGVLLGSLAIYTVVILVGFNRAGREFFKRSGDNEGNQFLFVLLALFLASVGAQLIGVEKIVGAFLCGLAVNGAVGNGAVKEKIVFVGSVLFIPIFFVNMGLLIRVPAFIKNLTSPQLLALTGAIVLGLIASKFAAALFAKLLYRYNWQEMMTMGSLSLPQVAATLAATLVGYRVGLLTEGVLNAVIILMLVTSTLGPVLTTRFASGLRVEGSDLQAAGVASGSASATLDSSRIVVPISNPNTERYLLEMAAVIAHHQPGQIVPLAIALQQGQLDTPSVQAAIKRSEMLLDNATAICNELNAEKNLNAEVEPVLRIDDKVAQGIVRSSREHHASLIVMGWQKRTRFQERLFGSVIDTVLWSSHCPVAVSRLLKSPSDMQQILVPIENLTQRSIAALQLAEIIATENQGRLTILHVCDRRTPPNKQAWIRSQLALLIKKDNPTFEYEVQLAPGEDVARAILSASQSSDLLVLRSSRRPTSAGGLLVGDITFKVAQQAACSVVMLGEPERMARAVLSTPQPVQRPSLT
ncbi:MAG: cation:proton antiporter [Myxacorys californica WJT36-NPBG1]|jgi:Kef-type K+ transport system membrane component KefB/nucleotide-binding universal stress UspA family protein|nr:cation:proton antiporter [Myxacorys californica WJT36-NPBG1]